MTELHRAIDQMGPHRARLACRAPHLHREPHDDAVGLKRLPQPVTHFGILALRQQLAILKQGDRSTEPTAPVN